MPNPSFITPVLTARSALGIAKETTYGTNVVPVRWIPVSAAKFEDAFKYYEDKSWRGLAAETYGHFQLTGEAAIQYDGPFYPDACASWAYGIMGQDTITAAPSATTTTGTNSAGSTSLTITSGVGYANHAAILIDAGAVQEGAVILSGGGTATLTLTAPLRFTHSAAAAVTGNTLHALQMAPNASVAVVPSFSLYDFYVENGRQIVGSIIEELSIKWTSETEASYSVKVAGQPSAIEGAQTQAFTFIPPFTGWQVGSLIAGGLQVNMEEFTITLKRKLAKVWGSNNQQGPVSILSTVLGVTGNCKFIMKDESEYNHFRNVDNPTLEMALMGPAPGQSGAVTASGMDIKMSNPQFIKMPLERSKDYVEVVGDFAADYNATDAGPAEIWITNALATLP